MFQTAKRFLEHVVPGVARPIHILWNQVIGFIFLVLALIPIPRAIHSFGKEGSGPNMFLTFVFVPTMAWFAISSFWRARKISKK